MNNITNDVLSFFDHSVEKANEFNNNHSYQGSYPTYSALGEEHLESEILKGNIPDYMREVVDLNVLGRYLAFDSKSYRQIFKENEKGFHIFKKKKLN